MSSGPFLQTNYEADSGEIHVIRVQPETVTLDAGPGQNTAPTAPPTSEFWAQVTRGSTEYGLRPRKVRFKWDAAPPTGYSPGVAIELPVLDADVFNAIQLNGTGTYLGAAIQVVGKIPENIYPGI